MLHLHLRRAIAIKLLITMTFLVAFIPSDITPFLSFLGNAAWLWIKLDA